MPLTTDKNIVIGFSESFPTYVEGTSSPITVTLVDIDGSTTDITSDPNTTIFALDDNIVFDDVNKILYFNREGSGVLKAVYVNPTNHTFSTTQKFVVHRTFFKDNYMDYFISTFEKQKLSKNKKLKIMMDTFMELLDILYAYNKDAKVLKSFTGVKSDFLDLLGQNIGFERIDYDAIDTPEEEAANRVYRQLLENVFDLLNIRGTNLSYELFFNALGYDIDLQEFWYDDESNLIEIDPVDDSLSTFYRYNTLGIGLDSPPYPRPDPRRFVNTNDVFRNNKSNYVRPIISSLNTNIAPPPSSFTARKRKVIRDYLEYLRPSHVQYIQELVSASLVNPSETLEQPDDELFISYLLYSIELVVEEIDYLDEIFSSSVPGSVNEEYSFKKRWDTGLKWDIEGHKWDDKQFLYDFFTVSPA